jgi:protein TonB
MKRNEKVLDLNEIIFEKRNKEYGAYLLRRLYTKYVSISTIGGAILFALIVCYPLITASLFPKEVMDKNNTKGGVIDFEDLNIPPINRPDLKIPLKTLPKTGTIKYLVPIIKPDEIVNEELIPTVEDLIDKNPGTETVDGNIDGNDILYVVESGISNNEVPVKEQIFTWVEEMPKFPGGDGELLSFFAKNIVYPEIAKRAGVEGRVILSFVVDKRGEINDGKVLKGIGAGCDDEAMRVLKSMPLWNPGRQNGKPILTRINIPVVFRLN